MTTLLFALAVATTLLPLWWWLPRRIHLLGCGLTLLAIVTATAATNGDEPPPPPATRPAVEPSDGYIGSARCRACHPGEHASWASSFHATMTQVATRTTLVPRFEELVLDWFGKPVRLQWRDDVLWVDFERGGAAPQRVQRPIEQLTGSHHMQVLWYSTGSGRQRAPVPMVYRLAERLWLPLSAVFVLPPEYRDPPEPGAWNENCQGCHATNSRPRVDTGRCDTEVGELGIACEACHGPGARHAEAHRNPLARASARRDDEPDPTVVEPGRLDPARSAQVCGQCHSVHVLRQQHHDHWREHGLVYRPGADLHGSTLVVDPSRTDAPELRRTLQHNPHFVRSAFWPDGEVRLAGREYNGLVRSPCYTHGDRARQMDCTSCHTMHGEGAGPPTAWRDDQLTAAARGNGACTACHPALAEPAELAAHSHHGADSAGSLCVNCHMPHTSIGLMKAVRSHTITKPSVATELATGRPNACNLCHLDRPLAWTAQTLAQWYGTAPPALAGDDAEVAAGVRWLLTGDAGQRLLAAWHLGWREAQAAAGTAWTPPFLARLLDDPYYVVRFRAAAALRSLPGGTELVGEYDFLAESAAVRPFAERVTAAWRALPAPPARPALLLGERGLDDAAFARLYARRDDRPLYLSE